MGYGKSITEAKHKEKHEAVHARKPDYMKLKTT
jgi:hypothetical protein